MAEVTSVDSAMSLSLAHDFRIGFWSSFPNKIAKLIAVV
jgi:hypothetical protein